MRKRKSLFLIIALLLAFNSASVANAASIGTKLTSPEPTWQRFDDTDSKISFVGSWMLESNSLHYNSTQHYANASAVGVARIKFNFKGTKLRIGSYTNTAYRISKVNVSIDGVVETYDPRGVFDAQILLYEKTGLTDTVHSVDIWNGDVTDINTVTYGLDYIDIDSVGSLLSYSDPLISLVQGGNSNINARIVIVNYAQARSIKQSLILPYSYALVKG